MLIFTVLQKGSIQLNDCDVVRIGVLVVVGVRNRRDDRKLLMRFGANFRVTVRVGPNRVVSEPDVRPVKMVNLILFNFNILDI